MPSYFDQLVDDLFSPSDLVNFLPPALNIELTLGKSVPRDVQRPHVMLFIVNESETYPHKTCQVIW